MFGGFSDWRGFLLIAGLVCVYSAVCNAVSSDQIRSSVITEDTDYREIVPFEKDQIITVRPKKTAIIEWPEGIKFEVAERMVILTFDRSYSRDEFKGVLEKIKNLNGKIVGQVPQIYQIQIVTPSNDAIIPFIKTLKDLPGVSSVVPGAIFEPKVQ